jgi:hypothetical protein
MRRFSVGAAALAAALVLAACGSDGGIRGGDGSAPDPTAAPTANASPSSGVEPAGGTTPGRPTGTPTVSWSSGPITVDHHVSVPPLPVLLGIRTAAHPEAGYDRVVFDFEGPLPGYTVRYVDEVRQDPSDRPVAMPGRRSLLVVFHPAQAHTDAGSATVAGGVRPLDHPMLRGYAQVGDFEGYVSIALGLDDVVGFRVGELPGRVYLDVAA